ncbi:DUF5994 family protein [Nocardia sp. NBC_00565]|uniref:DUF5994 family protein n=1 Tax=Nocardia sp. NBC_00565 TaxID=2975993 RepID=UPI002E7FCF78|nr:DUF5994 family protein [Nocardia sp. NBC_00565]WUC00972.1 DUF5994 family protein [Nocardia sp. NBC_00565]
MTHFKARRPITNHRDMTGSIGPPVRNRQPFRTPTRTPRLLLRGTGSGSGPVDGAWWPWTANLTAELHDLISVLTPRLGSTVRIGFDWNAVSLTQRRIDHDDGIQLHGPGSAQPNDIMHLVGTGGTRLTLLVIPADTPPDEANNRMRWASRTETPHLLGTRSGTH